MNFRFMQGRNGTDPLNIFLAGVLLFLGVLSIFISNLVFYLLQMGVLAYFCFRFFSRNIFARRTESDKFMRFTLPIRKFFMTQVKQKRDKDFKYFKCPKCSAKLRVPKNRGEIVVTCPVCKNKFDKRT